VGLNEGRCKIREMLCGHQRELKAILKKTEGAATSRITRGIEEKKSKTKGKPAGWRGGWTSTKFQMFIVVIFRP